MVYQKKKKLIEQLIELGYKYEIKQIVTNDVQYIEIKKMPLVMNV